jgi:Protein of unknown function (DUF3592)
VRLAGILAGIRLAYEYTVRGRRYVGSRSSWHGHWPSVTVAVRLALQYRPGRRVTVWYNPAEPSEAVLERGAGVANVVGVVVGLDRHPRRPGNAAHWGSIAIGIFAGQAVVLLGGVFAEPASGGLWPLGLLFLAAYSVLGLVGAGVGTALIRVRGRRKRSRGG